MSQSFTPKFQEEYSAKIHALTLLTISMGAILATAVRMITKPLSGRLAATARKSARITKFCAIRSSRALNRPGCRRGSVV